MIYKVVCSNADQYREGALEVFCEGYIWVGWKMLEASFFPYFSDPRARITELLCIGCDLHAKDAGDQSWQAIFRSCGVPRPAKLTKLVDTDGQRFDQMLRIDVIRDCLYTKEFTQCLFLMCRLQVMFQSL